MLSDAVMRRQRRGDQSGSSDQPGRRPALPADPVAEPLAKHGEQQSLRRESMRSICSKHSFLVFGSPLSEDNGIAAAVGCLKRGWSGTGRRSPGLGRPSPLINGARHATAVNSCSVSPHVGLLAAGMGLMTRSSIWEMWAETSQ